MVRAFHWQYVLQYELSVFYIIFIIVLSLENKYTIQYNTIQNLEVRDADTSQ